MVDFMTWYIFHISHEYIGRMSSTQERTLDTACSPCWTRVCVPYIFPTITEITPNYCHCEGGHMFFFHFPSCMCSYISYTISSPCLQLPHPQSQTTTNGRQFICTKYMQTSLLIIPKLRSTRATDTDPMLLLGVGSHWESVWSPQEDVHRLHTSHASSSKALEHPRLVMYSRRSRTFLASTEKHVRKLRAVTVPWRTRPSIVSQPLSHPGQYLHL